MLTASQFAKKHDFTRQWVHNLLKNKRISGARKVKAPASRGGWIWMIPKGAKIS